VAGIIKDKHILRFRVLLNLLKRFENTVFAGIGIGNEIGFSVRDYGFCIFFQFLFKSSSNA